MSKMMICNCADECTHDDDCDHKKPHEHMPGSCGEPCEGAENHEYGHSGECVEYFPVLEPITRSVSASELTEECWTVQMIGLNACETCEWLETKDCGGKQIRKSGKNSKGHKVPIGEWIQEEG